MKEKKLYKIAFMGDKDHGCDIISTLESWGGSNYYSRIGSDPEYVYFINDLGTIDLIHNSKMLSKEMKNFYFMFWHDYNIECHLKVGESINYDGQDYDVDSILFDANNRCIVYKLKSFGIGVEYITNNELTPIEECQTEEENNEYLCKNNMKRKLAIRGHATRGKEVIELLKMIGGKNTAYHGTDINVIYTIDDKGIIRSLFFNNSVLMKMEYNIFTLEEFLKKYPYKVGDKVVYEDDNDIVVISEIKWDNTVGDIFYNVKIIDEDDCFLCPPELLKPYKETNMNENKFGTAKNPLKSKSNAVKLVDGKVIDDLAEKNYEEQCDDMDKTIFMIGPVMVPDKVDDKLEYNIIDGYEFDKVENGKIILKPIKPKYPTTYEECCKVLGISYRAQLSYTYPEVEHNNAYLTKEKHLLDAFMKLRICRNAYWKIAGKGMDLDGSWEPKFGKTVLFDISFYFYQDNFVLHKGEYRSSDKCILVFSTKEMRDAFYENFKDLIEQCKELL